MGRLENGSWIVEDVISKSPTGEFKRQEQKFRDTIASNSPYLPENERYHLYASYACPWAHRTLIMRKLKGLERIIPISIVSPLMLQDGWTMKSDFPDVIGDPVFSKTYLKDVYTKVDPQFSGRVTVPILLDKKSSQIVNNESADIIRIMNSAFNSLTGNNEDYYPQHLQSEIDEINADVYDNINNGVYKTGFALNQEAYDKNYKNLFAALDRIDNRLNGRLFLIGDRLTEADIRLFTTLVRFDSVYFVHFKCNRTMIRDFKNLGNYVRRLYDIAAFRTTTNFDHIKAHYYMSHKQLNPTQIVPRGPEPLI